jgi:hypothetical protein
MALSKKGMRVATVLTGVTAGTAAFLPVAAPAAHAASRFRIGASLAPRMTYVQACALTLRGSRACVSYSKPGNSWKTVYPLTSRTGAVRSFTGSQTVSYNWSGKLGGGHRDCFAAATGGKLMIHLSYGTSGIYCHN